MNTTRGFEILESKSVSRFAESHESVARPLAALKVKLKVSVANSFATLKAEFGSVRALNAKVAVINLKGNDYRLTLGIDWVLRRAYFIRLGTHEEFKQWLPPTS